jgi:predicted acetyltransferase
MRSLLGVDELELIFPCEEYLGQIEEFKQKFAEEATGISDVSIHGCGSLGCVGVDEWLGQCRDYRAGVNLPEGYVPATQYMGIRKRDNKLVGQIQIRHRLTAHLEEVGGHIGYSVAPDERRKGYATMMLGLAIEKCRELGISRVRISCFEGNEASRRVILKFGAEYDGDTEFDGKVFERYWINLK